MTNSEIFLKKAQEKENLSEWEKEFVSQFEDWDKKDLRKLSRKQFKKMREIANK